MSIKINLQLKRTPGVGRVHLKLSEWLPTLCRFFSAKNTLKNVGNPLLSCDNFKYAR